MAISNSELIRAVHNSFARSDPFVNGIVDQNAKDQDVYHFIAYTPIRGALFELDGLSRGSVNLGSYDEDNWMSKANEAIVRRMKKIGHPNYILVLWHLQRTELKCIKKEMRNWMV